MSADWNPTLLAKLQQLLGERGTEPQRAARMRDLDVIAQAWATTGSGGKGSLTKGSADAPALSFKDAPKTGLFLDASGNLGFSQGGVAATLLSTTMLSSPQTITGVWSFGDGTGNGSIVINGAAGSARQLLLRTGGLNRWRVQANTIAESGGNAGSNFSIQAYDDAGTLIGSAVTIDRASQVVDFAVTPTVAGSPMSGGSSDPLLGWFA
jgi:hypothetical protein